LIALAIGVQVGLLAFMRRVDRRTAASIEANVRAAVARRDRLLGRSSPQGGEATAPPRP
jgi:hypothetical protein